MSALPQPLMTPIDANAPVGVFDSGVGGLSVLRHIRARLPQERLVYFSDARFAPYGGRPEHEIEARALAIGAFLVGHGVKAIVVACNTATAAAIAALRSAYPSLPLVGVEPGLKPAAALSATKIVGVLATEATLASKKFLALRDTISAATQVRFVLQGCAGLADQVEAGALESPATQLLLQRYVLPLLDQGADTLVLGCTHYPFVRDQIVQIIAAHTARPIGIVDTGAAVAQQLERLLAGHAALRTGAGHVAGFSSGAPAALADAFRTLLGVAIEVPPALPDRL
ncbi:glutamate racemase [Actimicrobium sp. GrIS 1.19]|uniref:glutamate racemase n=1 Tax=Actimicrobium sp. GrIS 1.19 TaxID=3071708 RepID=UPI002E0A5D15|nr:glutamate racemase [Actimicrobium sp. GrIS 1.19]